MIPNENARKSARNTKARPTMLKEERAASRAICDAATEGPWEAYLYTSEACGLHDARFIAHARTALPNALDALDEMEADRDGWKKATGEIEDTYEQLSDICATRAEEVAQLSADLSHWKDEYAALMDVCENHVGAYEAMKADPKLPRDIKVNHSIYRKGIPLSTLLLGIENLGKTFDQLWDSRQHWKAQTEARDRALNSSALCRNPECGWYGPCHTCFADPDNCYFLHDEDFPDHKDEPCPHWQFDQERFKEQSHE